MFRSALSKLIAVASVAFAAVTMPAPATAGYPDRPVRLVVPYQAGGATDLLARLLAQKLGDEFKQSFVVENRTGSAGMIGVAAVANAAPDGHTILIDAPGITLNPSLHKTIPYDPKALQPVAHLMSTPFVIVAHPKVPINNLKDLVDYARTNTGKFNVASAGSSTQLAGELFRLMNNVEFMFVPYKGSAPAGMSVVAGDTQAMFSDLPSVVQLIIGGQLRGVAVASNKRSPMLPDVPTTAELGMPEYKISQWFGAFVPANTPPEIVRTLNATMNRVMVQPDTAASLAKIAAEPVTQSVEEFSQFYRNELVRWKDVVTRANIPLK